MKVLLFIFGLLIGISGMSQVYPQFGARSAGIGGTGLTISDVYATYNNPGAFGALENTSVGITYENRFLLSELSTQAIAIGYSTEKSGNIGIHFQQYGFNLYREMQGGLTYGLKLAKRFYGGFGLNFHRIQLGENYGSKNTATGTVGLFYAIREDLNFGVRIQNLSRTKLAEFEDERLPTRFGVGASYIFSEKVFWTIEAEKDLLNPINVKSGLEIHPHEILYLRLGVNSYPFQSSFGFGLAFGKLRFDMATLWHSSLGMSPSAGLNFNF